MKKLNYMAIIISFFIFSQCGNNNKGPNEFFGIQWGTSVEKTKILLEENNLNYFVDGNEETIVVYSKYFNIYSEIQFDSMIQFHFFNNKFFTGRVIYPRFGVSINDDIKYTYNNIINEYVNYIDNKYGKEHIYELVRPFRGYSVQDDFYSWEYDLTKINISKGNYIDITFDNKKLRKEWLGWRNTEIK